MPPKFAQEKAERARTKDPDIPKQPNVFSAAELPYRVNHAIPPRPSFAKASSSSATPSTYTSNYIVPYHQRLVAVALGTTDDQQSSNDSSSAPSSNPMSSGTGSVGTSSTTSSSSNANFSKGKGKGTASATLQFVPRISTIGPSVPAPIPETLEYEPDSSYFERLMEFETIAKRLPPPGEGYFERRRTIWQTAPPNPPTPSSPSPSRIKLEALLSQPGAVESDEVWRAGLENVWKGLVGGNQLRKRLPLHIVLKILQAGWLRDGTWPEGMAPPPWDPPMLQTSSIPRQDDLSQGQGQTSSQQPRYVHEQEAYAAALHARASAEQAGSSAQLMHMQAYAMMGLSGGIPPGYSPSSGENPEEGYYGMPYAYAEATPPPGNENLSEEQEQAERRSLEQGHRREQVEQSSRTMCGTEEAPPSTPLHAEQGIDSEMDTEDEIDDEEADAGRHMEGVVRTGDGRHEGG